MEGGRGGLRGCQGNGVKPECRAGGSLLLRIGTHTVLPSSPPPHPQIKVGQVGPVPGSPTTLSLVPFIQE